MLNREGHLKRRVDDYILHGCIFIFFLSCLLLISNGRYGGDGFENYLTAESIVLNRDLAIYDRPFQITEMNYEPRGYKDSNGKIYSSAGIGMPLLLIPLYFTGHIISNIIPSVPHDYITQFFVSFANPIIIALTALVLFIFVIRLGFNRRTSFLTALAYTFCTMSVNYARSGFSDPTAGLLVLSAFLCIYMYERKGTPRFILFSGVLLGYSLLVKKNSFLYAPLFFAYMGYKSFYMKIPKQRIKFLAMGLSPFFVLALLYFYFRHAMGGVAISENKAGGIDEIVRQGTTYGGNLIKAFYYYLFSSGKSYFLYNVILILGLLGIKGMVRRDKKISLYLAVCILAPFIFYSYRFLRGSLFSWGPRYMYPTIPLLCIFLAEFIEEAKNMSRKILLLLFAAASFLVQLPPLFISFTKYLHFVKEKLGLGEYLINFIPELSPINGTWHLFISSIFRTFSGSSLNFVYNPDSVFIEPVVRSLSGYDTWDVWWLTVFHISPKLYPFLFCAVALLLVIACVSFITLRNIIGKQDQSI